MSAPSADMQFWRESLAGFANTTRLAIPRAHRLPGKSADRVALVHALAPDVSRQVLAVCTGRGVTLDGLACAAWARVLATHSGETDVVFGVTDDRSTLPLRLRVDVRQRISTWLGDVQAALDAVRANASVDLAQIHAVSELAHEDPMFETCVATADSNAEPVGADGPDVLRITTQPGSGIHLSWQGAGARVDEMHARDLLAQAASVLARLASEQEGLLWRVPAIEGAHAERMLQEWNATTRPFEPRTLHGMAEHHAAVTPDALAVVGGDGRLTYAQLDARANQLAHYLIGSGVRPGSRVALCMEKSCATVVAILATMKIGAAYVPLDPAYPAARIAYMIDDARPDALVTCGRGTAATAAVDLPSIALDTQWAQVADQATHRPAFSARPQAYAYVIYTSGSSGQPKGVMVDHLGRVNNIEDYCQRFALDANDRILCVSSLSFDISVCNLFCMLNVGGCLVFPDPELEKDPAHWLDLMRRERVTFWHSAPSLMDALLDVAEQSGAPIGLRVAVLDGDWIPLDQPRRTRAAFPSVSFVSAGGATELSIDSVMYPVGEVDPAWRSIPYGRPMANQIALVLNADLELVPPGVAGELYLGGVGVAAGYYRRPGLTAERFVAHPWPRFPGERLYRTGDLARLGADGVIELLGRVDFQVKIRGVRIELGEIEAALRRQSGVVQAVAAACRDRRGQSQLVGYVVAEAGSVIDPKQLRAALADDLPPILVPAAVVVLDRLPLSPNGKLDRRSLPTPELGHAVISAPRTATEVELSGLFASVLKIADVGVDDDFFDLGGHSLLATRLLGRIRSTFEIELSIEDLFQAPTVAALAQRLTQCLAHARATRMPLRPYPRMADEAIPLSYAQQRQWLVHELQGRDATYHIPYALHLRGPLDKAALAEALGDLSRRHEVLRTLLVEIDGTPYQQILPPEAISASALASISIDPQALAAALQDAIEASFDFSTEVPYRAALFALGPDEHVLLLVLHHIAGDGWSLAPLLRDLGLAYSARSIGHAPDWAPLPVQYADYALWQRELLGDETDPDSLNSRQSLYWRETLAGIPEQLNLPTDRPRSAITSHRGDAVRFEIDADLHRRLLGLAREHNATLFMVLHAALAALLSKLGAGEDIVIGTPIAGRTDHALDDLVGFFVNALVLRTDLSGNPSFRELLGRVRATDLGAYAHQDLPFERLVEVLNPARSRNQHPLFQVLLVLQNNVAPNFALPGLDVTAEPVDSSTAKFDLSLIFTESEDGGTSGIKAQVEYSVDLFDRATVQALSGSLTRLLHALSSNPDLRLDRVCLLSEDERPRILLDWNDTSHEIDDLALPEMFERQVIATPDAIAVISGSQSLSYRELDARANRLAQHLRTLGIAPDARIGLCLDRSIDLLVGIVGIVKAGAAYLPLDPSYPPDRLAYMIEDTGAEIIVTHSGLLSALPVQGKASVLIDCDAVANEQCPDQAPKAGFAPDQLAYVMYTSGSTGKPKGIAITHRNVVQFALDRRWKEPSQQRILLHSTQAFDANTYEVWPSLLNGGQLVVAPPGKTDLGTLAETIEAHRVSGLFMSAGLFHLMANECPQSFKSVKQVIVGGDIVSAVQARTLLERCPDLRVVNGYGPTETTTFATHHVVDRNNDSASLPIGAPLDNTHVYVLDRHLQPVPVSVPGELYIGGTGCARGYLDRRALTAERFVANPFSSGERMYRSGDLVRWLPDGQLDFLGRVDQQVKIRGFRIELGELENALLALPEVSQTCVVVHVGSAGQKELVAYVVAGSGSIDANALRTQLARTLPDYMLPAVVIPLDALPLTANGKVDRTALPRPTYPNRSASANTPRSAQEEILQTLFAEVLGVPDVGIYDNFFELGGHSLLAAQLASRIRAMLELPLTIRDLFDAPTVAALAQRLIADAAGQTPTMPVLTIRGGGNGAPVFCFHPASGLGWAYSRLMPFVDGDHPIYALQAKGFAADETPHESLRTMVDDYLASMRSLHPQGPYHLVGWSFGGLVAFEIACELKRQGEEVGLLAVLDTGFLESPQDDRGDDQYLDELLAMEGIDRVPGAGTPSIDEAFDLLCTRNSPFTSLGRELFATSIEIYRNNMRLFRASPPSQHYPGQALLVSSTVGADGARLPTLVTEGWPRVLTGPLEHLRVDCSHYALFDTRQVAAVGEAVARGIAMRRHPTPALSLAEAI